MDHNEETRNRILIMSRFSELFSYETVLWLRPK